MLLLLTGCVPTAPMPSMEPTDSEVEAWLTRQDDWLWDSTSIDDASRPRPEHVLVESSEWMSLLSDCMTDRGYSAYDSDTTPQLTYVFDHSDDLQERIDWYECQVTYQIDPAEYGLVGGEMLDYLYRYNTTVLVPCLEAHGVSVVDVPTREQAGAGGEFEGWNPYHWMRHLFDPKANPDDRLVYESCPAFPHGSQFDEWRNIW